MSKTIGYSLMILGVVLIALPLAFQETAAQIPLITQNILFTIIIGILLLVAGFFFSKKRKPKHISSEVPIYEGEKVIGYRKEK